MEFADLELSLYRRSSERYGVELRFTHPHSDADIRLAGDEITIPFERLHALQDDPIAYGTLLSGQLFAPPALRRAFAQARAAAATLAVPLRMRLFVAPGAAELHALRWETLRDPEDERPLLTDERLLFSRFLASGDWQPITLRARAALRAMVAIANPSDLADYELTPVDVPGELARVREALGDIPLVEVPATLAAIVAELREGYDICYLVCHGKLVEGEPWLWLENEQGATVQVAGAELAVRIQELTQRPRLVVLASCQSAGDGGEQRSSDDGTLAALGPRLAEVGVPAVVAMQGSVTMETIAACMPVFFRELLRDGQIDRALTVARGAVRERPDSWMPVLFMRLRSGRIWYVPGFAGDPQGFEKWPTIVRAIKRGQCTPVLGADLAAATLGSSRELATRWADTYGYPLAAHQRSELHEVAQYLAIHQAPHFPRDELAEYLRRTLVERFAAELPPDAATADMYDLFEAVGAFQRAQNANDPYKILAAQHFPIYVTSATHSLLSVALRAAGKDPVVEFCRWNEDIDLLPKIYDEEPKYLPSVERPLVFHLFGVLDELKSLVLTEDDHFDYLMQVARVPDLIPPAVRGALNSTALLFLGFRIDSWDFRVLYRSLMQQEGRAHRSDYAHVAGQVAPDEDNFLLPERARRYFEGYFQHDDVSIFWGSVDDFAQQLQAQLAADPTPVIVPSRQAKRR